MTVSLCPSAPVEFCTTKLTINYTLTSPTECVPGLRRCAARLLGGLTAAEGKALNCRRAMCAQTHTAAWLAQASRTALLSVGLHAVDCGGASSHQALNVRGRSGSAALSWRQDQAAGARSRTRRAQAGLLTCGWTAPCAALGRALLPSALQLARRPFCFGEH